MGGGADIEEESRSKETGNVGPTVSVVDADERVGRGVFQKKERVGRGGKHLRLVLHGQVRLRSDHQELSCRMRPGRLAGGRSAGARRRRPAGPH